MKRLSYRSFVWHMTDMHFHMWSTFRLQHKCATENTSIFVGWTFCRCSNDIVVVVVIVIISCNTIQFSVKVVSLFFFWLNFYLFLYFRFHCMRMARERRKEGREAASSRDSFCCCRRWCSFLATFLVGSFISKAAMNAADSLKVTERVKQENGHII